MLNDLQGWPSNRALLSVSSRSYSILDLCSLLIEYSQHQTVMISYFCNTCDVVRAAAFVIGHLYRAALAAL